MKYVLFFLFVYYIYIMYFIIVTLNYDLLVSFLPRLFNRNKRISRYIILICCFCLWLCLDVFPNNAAHFIRARCGEPFAVYGAAPCVAPRRSPALLRLLRALESIRACSNSCRLIVFNCISKSLSPYKSRIWMLIFLQLNHRSLPRRFLPRRRPPSPRPRLLRRWCLPRPPRRTPRP